MACNLKAGVISIAVIVIVFAALNLGKVSYELAKHRHHHGHHHDRHHHDKHGHHGHHKHGKHGKHGHHKHHDHHHHHDDEMTTTNSPPMPEIVDDSYLLGRDEKRLAYEREHMMSEKMETTQLPRMSDGLKPSPMRHRKSVLIIGIVVDLVTIFTACLVFAAVSDDVAKNQRRRHFLVPFIVWHVMGVVILIAGGIYALVIHEGLLKHLVLPIIIFLTFVGVLILFIHITTKYFNSLNASSGFDYGQMVDDDIKKQPLA